MVSVTLEQVQKHPLVVDFIKAADDYLGAIGYTEHGLRHVTLVAAHARHILQQIAAQDPAPELSAIAGYLHDVGNVINRVDHGQSGALIAMEILRDLKADAHDIAEVISAIGNHEESNGLPISQVAAGLILADKADVHRSRVRNTVMETFDIHDRVNYASQGTRLKVERKSKKIVLELSIDSKMATVAEYFEIFLPRMSMCRKAAHFLKCDFNLYINKTKLL